MFVVSVTRGTAFRVVHRGDASTMPDRVAKGVRSAAEVTEHFVAVWGHLRREQLSDAAAVERVRSALLLPREAGDELVAGVRDARTDEERVRAVFGALAESKLDGLDWPVRRDAMVELLMRGWEAEPGGTTADVVNAVTRLHDGLIPAAQWGRVEVSAGALVAALA